MFVTMRKEIEKARLADELRELAVDVRRLVNSSDDVPAETVEGIVERIDALKQRFEHLPPSELHRWIDGLMDQVQRAEF